MNFLILTLNCIRSFFSKCLIFIFYYLLDFFIKTWHMTRTIRLLFNFPCCRFYPSCSDYLLQSIKIHGLLSGLILWVKRIVKCHPLCEGGIDGVPEKGFRIQDSVLSTESCLLNPESRS